MSKELNEPKKPLSVAREEFCHNLLELVNNSGLPAFVIQPIFTELQTIIANASKEQYENDLKLYNEQIIEYEKRKKCSDDNI